MKGVNPGIEKYLFYNLCLLLNLTIENYVGPHYVDEYVGFVHSRRVHKIVYFTEHCIKLCIYLST